MSKKENYSIVKLTGTYSVDSRGYESFVFNLDDIPDKWKALNDKLRSNKTSLIFEVIAYVRKKNYVLHANDNDISNFFAHCKKSNPCKFELIFSYAPFLIVKNPEKTMFNKKILSSKSTELLKLIKSKGVTSTTNKL